MFQLRVLLINDWPHSDTLLSSDDASIKDIIMAAIFGKIQEKYLGLHGIPTVLLG
jgi:hypothetical protein